MVEDDEAACVLQGCVGPFFPPPSVVVQTEGSAPASFSAAGSVSRRIVRAQCCSIKALICSTMHISPGERMQVAQDCHGLPPAGETSRCSPPPSNIWAGFSAGLAERIAVSVRGLWGHPVLGHRECSASCDGPLRTTLDVKKAENPDLARFLGLLRKLGAIELLP